MKSKRIITVFKDSEIVYIGNTHAVMKIPTPKNLYKIEDRHLKKGGKKFGITTTINEGLMFFGAANPHFGLIFNDKGTFSVF